MPSGSRETWRWLIPVVGIYSVVAFRGFTRLQAIAAAVTITVFLLVTARRYDVNSLFPIVGFTLLFGVLFTDSLLHFMPAHTDANGYDLLAWRVTRALLSGEIPDPPHVRLRVNAYVYYVGTVYVFTGRNQLLMGTINAGLWTTAIIFWMRMAKLLTPETSLGDADTTAALTGILLIASPATYNYMLDNFREPVAMFSLTMTCFLFVAWLRSFRHRYLVASGIALVPAALVRPELFAAVIVVGSLFSVVTIIRRTGAVVPSLSLAAVSGWAFLTYFVSTFNVLAINWLEHKRQGQLQGDPKGYLHGLEYASWVDTVQYLPVRSLYLLLTPFPWELENYAFFISTVDSVYVLVLLPLAVLGVMYRFHSGVRDTHLFLAATGLVIVAGYAIVVTTAGTSTRRRIFAVPILALFGAYFLTRVFEFEVTLPVGDPLHDVVRGPRQRRGATDTTTVDRIYDRSAVSRIVVGVRKRYRVARSGSLLLSVQVTLRERGISWILPRPEAEGSNYFSQASSVLRSAWERSTIRRALDDSGAVNAATAFLIRPSSTDPSSPLQSSNLGPLTGEGRVLVHLNAPDARLVRVLETLLRPTAVYRGARTVAVTARLRDRFERAPTFALAISLGLVTVLSLCLQL